MGNEWLLGFLRTLLNPGAMDGMTQGQHGQQAGPYGTLTGYLGSLLGGNQNLRTSGSESNQRWGFMPLMNSPWSTQRAQENQPQAQPQNSPVTHLTPILQMMQSGSSAPAMSSGGAMGSLRVNLNSSPMANTMSHLNLPSFL